MTKDNIIVPRWFLEVVENTLQIQHNINLDEKTEETCQDRNIRQSLNGVRKLLNGEELTGMERLEKPQPSLPSNLDEVAKEYAKITSVKVWGGINPTKEHKLYIGYFAVPCPVYYVHELQHFLSDCKIQESLLI